MVMGPGGRPIQMPAPSPSNWVCPACGDNPPIAQDARFPFGTPVANVTQMPDEPSPTFHCMRCFQMFQAQLTRLNVPALRRKDEVAAQSVDQNAAVAQGRRTGKSYGAAYDAAPPELQEAMRLQTQSESPTIPEYDVIEPEENQPDLTPLTVRPGKKSDGS